MSVKMAAPLLSTQQIRHFTAPVHLRVKFLQPSRPTTAPQELITGDASGSVDRAAVVAAIVQDFLSSYVVTGNVTSGAYENDCEFEDPILSFKGLQRFKRNCTNFGFLVLKSNLKFTKWEDFEDKGIAHWEFSFVLSLPWTPLLSTTGCTEFHFDAESGKVCRHIEKRDVPIMMLFKQIFMPSRYSDPKGEKGKSRLTTEVAAEMAARVVAKCN
ncbi:uncharacterized protein LOC141605083 isoform X2 [Silene latifolia]|uniref:uncharacterized protein LOC141605083 isoform X2 n=1 Tax=Silene latifolia TaxID=37657 RepID=UPI003D78AB88